MHFLMNLLIKRIREAEEEEKEKDWTHLSTDPDQIIASSTENVNTGDRRRKKRRGGEEDRRESEWMSSSFHSQKKYWSIWGKTGD